MKNLLLSLCTLALSASVAIAEEPAQTFAVSSARADIYPAAAHAPSRALEEMDFSLASGEANSLSFNNVAANTEIIQAVEFSPELCEKYAGAVIKSINVVSGQTQTFPSLNNITDVTVFLAEDVTSTTRIVEKPAKLSGVAFHVNKIELDEPIAIEAGKPFVFGYSLKSKTNSYYIIADYNITTEIGGCWIKVGTNKWTNFADQIGNLFIGITVQGEHLPSDQAAVRNVSAPAFVNPNVEFNVEAELIGQAVNIAKDFVLSCKVGDAEPVLHNVTVDGGLAFNQTGSVTIKASTTETGLNIPVEVNVVKVNGSDVTATPSVAYFNSLEKGAGFTKRFVVEEGTGTWCGWCPAGIVMMESLRDNYPDRVIRIALHSSDEMTVNSTADVINLFSGFPQAYLDRTLELAPTSPLNNNLMNGYLKENMDYPSLLGVEVDWKKIDANSVSITATVEAAVDMANSNRYRIAFYLTEDGVGPYNQQNYYAGGSRGKMDGWENKASVVSTIYDDVARLLLGKKSGFSYSIPTDIVKGESYTYTTTATTTAIVSDNYFITAMIVDNQTGQIVNARQVAASKSLDQGSALKDVEGNSVVVAGGNGAVNFSGEYTSAVIYNVAGAVVATAAGESSVALPAGLYIVKAGDTTAKVAVK